MTHDMTRDMTRLNIQRHGVLRGWGAGLNNLHLECIRLLGFTFPIYFILLATHVGLPNWHRILQGGWKWRSGFGNLGGWWKPPCKKDGDRLFTIWFLFSLSIVPVL